MSMPELGPGRTMGYKAPKVYKGGATNDDYDDDDLSFQSSEDARQSMASTQEADRPRRRQVMQVDNSAELRELERERDSLKQTIKEMEDERDDMEAKLRASNFTLQQLQAQTGMPLILGVIDKASQGPIVKPVNKVDSTNNKDIRQVVAGEAHNLLLTTSGEVYAWGKGENGQLGLNDTENRAEATRIPQLSRVRFVAAGPTTSFAVTEDNMVYAWGDNASGQLGTGDEQKVLVPTHVGSLPVEFTVLQIAAGQKHTLFLNELGEVYSCGSSSHAQNGHKNRNLRLPAKISTLEQIFVTQVSAGERQSVVVGSSGNVQGDEPEELTQRASYLAKREETLVRKHKAFLKELAGEFERLGLQTKNLKKEIIAQDAHGNVSDGQELTNKLNELADRIKSDELLCNPNALSFVSQTAGSAPHSRGPSRTNSLVVEDARGGRASIVSVETGEAAEKITELNDIHKVAAKVQKFWDILKGTTLAEVSKRKLEEDDSFVSIPDLIADSNQSIANCCNDLQAAFQQQVEAGTTHPTSLMPTLLLENGQLRRTLNDYTTGILAQTSRRLDEFKQQAAAQNGGRLSSLFCA